MGRDQYDSPSDIETQQLLLAGRGKSKMQFSSLEADKIMWVAIWMLFSSFVVIYNKWIFSTGGFPYPLALTSMHMICCFVFFGAIRKFAPDRIRLKIMPDADVTTDWSTYCKSFLLIAFFFATTLGTGNLAYLFSSVSFVQMMKPMNCIFASLAAFIVGVEIPTTSHVIIVCTIFAGVFLASHGSAQFSMIGCAFQITSSLFEGLRLALVQVVTSSGMKLDPVTTVYHYSFASAVLLSCACFWHEWPLDFSKLVSPWVLVLNCGVAMILNVLVATVIKKTSAVVFCLSGIVKDLLIIVTSSIIFVTPITSLMMMGYVVSVSGLCMYKAYKDNLSVFKEHGFLEGLRLSWSSMRT